MGPLGRRAAALGAAAASLTFCASAAAAPQFLGVDLSTGAGPRSIAAADLDGDGNTDLATANVFDDNVTVILGNGDEIFGPTTATFAAGDGPIDIAAADFN